ncbi:hypothetical protein R6Q57_028686 [Mikania cordata]
MKHAARVMVPAKTGSIISMASIASSVAGVTSHAYCMCEAWCCRFNKEFGSRTWPIRYPSQLFVPHEVATPLATNYNGNQAEALRM